MATKRGTLTVDRIREIDARDILYCVECGRDCWGIWEALRRRLDRGRDGTADGRRYADRWWRLLLRLGVIRRSDRRYFLRAIWDYHHQIPLFRGGPDTNDNIQTLCPVCHRRAHGARGLSRA